MFFNHLQCLALCIIEILYIRLVSGYSIPPHHETGSRSFDARKPGNIAKAVYFMTNTASNAVVGLNIAPDGTIAGIGSVTSTNGIGGNLLSSTDFTPNGPDALGSQGSIQVLDNVSRVIFTVAYR